MPRIPQITIDQQLAEIGINSTPAQMHIDRRGLTMKIQTEAAQMEIERKNPSFKINRKKINSESGMKPTPELARDFRDKGRAGALRGARTAAQDGNFLGDLRRPGDRVGKLARNKKMSAILKKREYNIGLMPKTSPEVEWEKGQLNISWSRYSIKIDWEGEYMPTLTIDPRHSIEIYLRTAPYFRVLVSEGEDAAVSGRLVDTTI